MASIRKRGATYQIRWQRLDGRPDSCTVHTLEAARQREREILRALDEGREWQPVQLRDRPLLLDVARAYVDHRRLRVRPRTLANEGRALDLFFRFAGEREVAHVDELSRALLDDFAGWLADPATSVHGAGRKAQTVKRAAEAALLMWQWAVDSERWRGVPSPPRSLDLPRSRPAPVVAPTWAEMDACVNAANGWQRALATWLRWTGLRVGESMLFTWEHVDMERSTLTIPPEIDKTGQGRMIPLAPALLDMMAGWGRRVGFLLPSGRRKGPREREARGRDMARAWARAGVREAAWRGHPDHAFRRGFKSGLLALGAHPDAIDFLQGHSLGGGSRGRYIDGGMLPLRETVAMVPAVGQGSENVVKLEVKR